MRKGERTYLMRHSRYLWGVGCLLVALVIWETSVFAAQPLTGTFRGSRLGRRVVFTNPNGSVVTDYAGALNLQLDLQTPGDGKGPLVAVFCIELNVEVRRGDRYMADGPVTAVPGGCQIRYLLGTYPASTAATADEAAARQLVIWHFSDNVDLTTIQDPAIRSRALALADEASAYVALNGCPSADLIVTTLTITPPTTTVPVGAIATYTLHTTPAVSQQTVTLQISGGATFANGQQDMTLQVVQGTATFSIIGATLGTSIINATMPYRIDAGTVFSPIDGNNSTQRLVLAERQNVRAFAAVQALTVPGTTPTPTSGARTPQATITPTPLTTPTPGSAPPPSPSVIPPSETPLLNLTPSPTDTPFTEIPPTSPPKHPKSPTHTPPTTTPGEFTATPEGGANQTPIATPVETPMTPIETPGFSNNSPRPSSLPNTSAAKHYGALQALSIAVLLFLVGFWLRRRAARR